MPRRSPRKPPRVARVARRDAVMQTPRKVAGQPTRKVGEDVKTPMLWRIITTYLQLSSGKPRLPRGGMEKLKMRFLHWVWALALCSAQWRNTESKALAKLLQGTSTCRERETNVEAIPWSWRRTLRKNRLASTAKLGDDFHARRLQKSWQKKVIKFPVNLYGTGARH